jgi:hypothetical protein
MIATGEGAIALAAPVDFVMLWVQRSGTLAVGQPREKNAFIV